IGKTPFRRHSLSGALAQVFYDSREKETPGKEPDKMQRPIRDCGQLVVVLRITFAEESQQMLVHEVEPEEPLISHSRENVPWRGNCEKEKCAGYEMKLAPPLPLSGGDQVSEQRAPHENDCYKPLRQHCQSQAGIRRVPKPRSLSALKPK